MWIRYALEHLQLFHGDESEGPTGCVFSLGPLAGDHSDVFATTVSDVFNPAPVLDDDFACRSDQAPRDDGVQALASFVFGDHLEGDQPASQTYWFEVDKANVKNPFLPVLAVKAMGAVGIGVSRVQPTRFQQDARTVEVALEARGDDWDGAGIQVPRVILGGHGFEPHQTCDESVKL